MLESLLGNKSAEKVMLAIYSNGEMHASAIAKEYSTALDPIKKQLERFCEAGFLTCKIVGRSKVYKFNEAHPFIEPLKELIQIASLKSKTLKKEQYEYRNH
jgi:predicted transcriptional regulator